jgi:hypothetical protein
MPDTSPGDGAGAVLRRYWTRDPRGLAKWARSAHPWSALHRHLSRHITDNDLVDRLTETYYRAVFGRPSGERRGKNPSGPG